MPQTFAPSNPGDTLSPTEIPSVQPVSSVPSACPSGNPSRSPTVSQTDQPIIDQPIVTNVPSFMPTNSTFREAAASPAEELSSDSVVAIAVIIPFCMCAALITGILILLKGSMFSITEFYRSHGYFFQTATAQRAGSKSFLEYWRSHGFFFRGVPAPLSSGGNSVVIVGGQPQVSSPLRSIPLNTDDILLFHDEASSTNYEGMEDEATSRLFAKNLNNSFNSAV
jgi:hypothetical protein